MDNIEGFVCGERVSYIVHNYDSTWVTLLYDHMGYCACSWSTGF
jgi:hypothetical protein